MNILFLTFAYLPSTGGVQRSVRNLAAELVSRGHRVTIATDGPWSGIAERGLQPGTPADVLVLHIPTAFHWSFTHRVKSALRDGYNLLRLAWLCRRRRIEVIHCHLLNVDTRYAAVLKRFLGIRMVITLRGDELTTWIEGKPHRVEYVRRMLRTADIVTALSQAQMDAARELEPALSCAEEAIPNPAAVEAIRAAVDAEAIVPSRPYLLFLGRFVPFKSIDTLIEAYHGVIRQDPAFPLDLVLVGDGELEKPLREQAAQGAAAARIHFAGLRSWPESLRLIQQARFLVLPSHEAEGCPNVLMEAMALGTPVIVSDSPQLTEMVSAGVNGEVFPRRDAAALQACLESVSLDVARREQYAREGFEFLKRRHSFSKIVNAYERIYAQLCPQAWAEPISILMPCKSQKQEYFMDAVGSVVRQGLSTWQLLVLTDPTSPPEIAEWANRFADPRIRVLPSPATGFAPALNHGLQQAPTPFVSILLSDDRYAPNTIETLAAYRKRYPDIDFFHSARRYIDESGQRIGGAMPSRDNFQLSDFYTSGSPVKHLLCWRTEKGLSIGGMNEALSVHGCDDYDFPWRMAEAGATFHAVPECLYEYRWHTQHARLTTSTSIETQIETIRTMFASHDVPEPQTDRYVQRAIDTYLTIEATNQVHHNRGANIEVRCFRDAPESARERFLEAGIAGRYFFPHRVFVFRKAGPDGMKLTQKFAADVDPASLRELVLYALPPSPDDFPESLFFDDDLQWHRQQFGLPAQVAFANFVVEKSALRCSLICSDLVQRVARVPAYRSRIDNRFKGWHRLVLNALLDYARENGIATVYLADSLRILQCSDPKRQPKPELYERIYDSVSQEMEAVHEDGWWRFDVEHLNARIAPLERGFAAARWPKTVCIVHDVEEGIGHRDTGPEFSQRADRKAGEALTAMLEIERKLGVRATYNLVGQLYNKLEATIRPGGHAVAFHSYDHKIATDRGGDDGCDQLWQCRSVDYRTKGYRPPQSKIPSGLSAANLTHFNFDWLASSRISLGFENPRMESGLAWIPIHTDDYAMFRDKLPYEKWEAKMLELVAARDFVAIGLHDCYAEFWLPYYERFLERLQANASLVTMDAVAEALARGSARWFE